jgi:hypothetical protein
VRFAPVSFYDHVAVMSHGVSVSYQEALENTGIKREHLQHAATKKKGLAES